MTGLDGHDELARSVPRARAAAGLESRTQAPAISWIDGPLLVLWALVLFGAALPGDYLSDDFFLIAHFADGGGGIRAGALLDLWTQPPHPDAPGFVRPLWEATYFLDAHFIQWGWGAPASRVVGVLLHAACAWLLLNWMRTLGVGLRAARFAAYLAVLMPFSPEAVLWVAARCDPLATAGVLTALLVRGRALAAGRGQALGPELGVWLAMLGALWSKEPAAAGGLVLLAQEFVHPARVASGVHERARICRGFVLRGLLVAVAIALHRLWLLDGSIGGYAGADARFHDLAFGVGRNLSVLTFPVGFSRALPLSEPNTLLVAAAGSLALLAVFGAPRMPAALRLACLWLLASVWVAGGLHVDRLPSANSRFLHQPTFGWCMAAAVALGLLLPRASTGAPTRRSLVQALGLALVVAAFRFLGPSIEPYRTAQQEMARFRAAVAERLAAGSGPILFVDLPDTVGGAVHLGLNAFPSSLAAPFVGPSEGGARRRAAGLTAEEARAGRLAPVELMMLFHPETTILSWDGQRLSEVGSIGSADEPRPRFLLERGSGPDGPVLELSGIEPGALTFLLVGELGDGVALGAAGRPDLLRPRIVNLGRAGERGEVGVEREWARARLPGSAGLALQGLAIEGAGVRLSNPLP